MDKKDVKKQQTKAQEQYPGASTGDTCNRKVDKAKVESDVKYLNNNPRNNDIDE